MDKTRATHPDRWVAQVFSAKAVGRGGMVRRNRDWVESEIGRDRFIDECKRRGFGLLEVGGQYVVICSRGSIRWLA